MKCFKHTQSETEWRSEPHVPPTQLEQSLQALILFQGAPHPTSIPSPTNMHISLTGNFFFMWTIFNAFLN